MFIENSDFFGKKCRKKFILPNSGFKTSEKLSFATIVRAKRGFIPGESPLKKKLKDMIPNQIQISTKNLKISRKITAPQKSPQKVESPAVFTLVLGERDNTGFRSHNDPNYAPDDPTPGNWAMMLEGVWGEDGDRAGYNKRMKKEAQEKKKKEKKEKKEKKDREREEKQGAKKAAKEKKRIEPSKTPKPAEKKTKLSKATNTSKTPKPSKVTKAPKAPKPIPMPKKKWIDRTLKQFALLMNSKSPPTNHSQQTTSTSIRSAKQPTPTTETEEFDMEISSVLGDWEPAMDDFEDGCDIESLSECMDEFADYGMEIGDENMCLLNDYGLKFHRVDEKIEKPIFYEKNSEYQYGQIDPNFTEIVDDMVKNGKKAPEILLELIIKYMMPICEVVAASTNARLDEEFKNVPLD